MSVNLKTFRKLTNGFARHHHFNFAIVDWRDSTFDDPILGKILGGFTAPLQSMFCSSTTLPEKSIKTEAVPIHYGMPGITIASDVNYSPWTVTFYSDEVLMLRTMFLRWMELINNTDNQQFSLPARYKSTFAYASVLTPSDMPVHVYSFKGLFPISVGAITMQQQDTNVLTFNVTFGYDFFSVNKDPLAFLASVGLEKIQNNIISNGRLRQKKIALPGGVTINAPF